MLPGKSALAYLRRESKKEPASRLASSVGAQSIPALLSSTLTWTNSSARPNPAWLEGDAVPGNVPQCGQNAATAVDIFGRLSSFSSSRH